VSWRGIGVVARIAVLLVATGMAPFVSRNRRKKGCQRIERWMFLSAPVLPQQMGVTRKIYTLLAVFLCHRYKGQQRAERRGPAAISLPLCRLRTRSMGTCGFA